MAAPRLTPQQIAARARGYNLDPDAVLRVAGAEGLSGGIGDGGHAYGPWQLNNAGGVISGQYGGRVNDRGVQDWAWSPQGVDFALSRIAQVARGLHGSEAVNAIVRRFERPRDPNGEVARALGGGPMASQAGARPVPPMEGGGGGVAAPQPDRQQLVQALMGASGSGDYSAFFQKLKQSRSGGTPAPVAQAGAPPLAQPPMPGGHGQVIGGQGENPGFLSRLSALAAFEGAPVDINSGYRSRAKQAQLYANRGSNPNPVAAPGHSLHEQGLAADGTVKGIPLGRLPAALLARFGLATVPGDSVHVQIAR